MPPQSFVIVIPVYDQFNILDLAGPYEMFRWLKTYWTKANGGPTEVSLLVVGDEDPSTGGPLPVTCAGGVQLMPDATFRKCPQYDLLIVPGGDPDALPTPVNMPHLFDFLNANYAGASYITSVCVGSLILAAGGFLDNCNATTHWAALDTLKTYPKIAVAPGFPRYVWCTVNGKTIVTGGGVSSSLDTALFLVEKITGSSVIAGTVQLYVQYNPQPPLNDGDPSVASPQVLTLAGVNTA